MIVYNSEQITPKWGLLSYLRSNFAYAFFCVSAQQRAALQAVYGFCRVVDDCVDEPATLDTKQQRLQVWIQELDAVFAGTATQPIGQALQASLQYFPLAKQHLLAVCHGMQQDLYGVEYTQFTEIEQYCYYVAGSVGLLVIAILGFLPVHTAVMQEYAIAMGQALQLINIVRDVAVDLAMGRVYFAIEDLAACGLSRTYLLSGGYTPAAMQPLLALYTQRARAAYGRALALLPASERRGQRCALIMAGMYLRLLEQLERRVYFFSPQRVRLTWWQKLSVFIRVLSK